MSLPYINDDPLLTDTTQLALEANSASSMFSPFGPIGGTSSPSFVTSSSAITSSSSNTTRILSPGLLDPSFVTPGSFSASASMTPPLSQQQQQQQVPTTTTTTLRFPQTTISENDNDFFRPISNTGGIGGTLINDSAAAADDDDDDGSNTLIQDFTSLSLNAPSNGINDGGFNLNLNLDLNTLSTADSTIITANSAININNDINDDVGVVGGEIGRPLPTAAQLKVPPVTTITGAPIVSQFVHREHSTPLLTQSSDSFSVAPPRAINTPTATINSNISASGTPGPIHPQAQPPFRSSLLRSASSSASPHGPIGGQPAPATAAAAAATGLTASGLGAMGTVNPLLSVQSPKVGGTYWQGGGGGGGGGGLSYMQMSPQVGAAAAAAAAAGGGTARRKQPGLSASPLVLPTQNRSPLLPGGVAGIGLQQQQSQQQRLTPRINSPTPMGNAPASGPCLFVKGTPGSGVINGGGGGGNMQYQYQGDGSFSLYDTMRVGTGNANAAKGGIRPPPSSLVGSSSSITSTPGMMGVAGPYGHNGLVTPQMLGYQPSPVVSSSVISSPSTPSSTLRGSSAAALGTTTTTTAKANGRTSNNSKQSQQQQQQQYSTNTPVAAATILYGGVVSSRPYASPTPGSGVQTPRSPSTATAAAAAGGGGGSSIVGTPGAFTVASGGHGEPITLAPLNGERTSPPTASPSAVSGTPAAAAAAEGLGRALGHIAELSRDQEYSRALQQWIEKAPRDLVSAALEEVRPCVLGLVEDMFGNYVVQKLLEHCELPDAERLVSGLRGHVLELTLNKYGCRVIQKALDCVGEELREALARELAGNIVKCVVSQDGNHVIQKCLTTLEAKGAVFIVEAFRGHVVECAKHPYGCRVIQLILDNGCQEHIRIVAPELVEALLELVQDQYGNYVLQRLVVNDKAQEFRPLVAAGFAGHAVALAGNKFASNVIEACLKYCTIKDKMKIAREIATAQAPNNSNSNSNSNSAGKGKGSNGSGNVNGNGAVPPIVALAEDQFGNYVVQSVLDVISHDKELFTETILKLKPHVQTMKRSQCSKRVVSRVESANIHS